MRLGEVCRSPVITCARGASASAVALLMREQHVGDVVVVDEVEGRQVPVGIVTDRDLVVRVLATGDAAPQVSAGECMSVPLVTACEHDDVYDAIWRMRGKGVRRLPVVDADRRLCGIITADDISAFLSEELIEVARTLPRTAHRRETSQDS